MAGTPIGRILLMPKGNYSGTAVYYSLDWVRYNGSAWVCTTDNTTGIAPAIGVPEWQVLAQDGTVSGTVDWSNVNFKPFDTVGSGLDVDVSNTLKLDMSMLTGSNISYDNSGSGAASSDVQGAIDELFRGGGGGGLLPYFFIDSEAGSTVTVNVPDGSTITPTPAGSGHWECSVPMYGTYTIHSVLAGQGDATVSVNVDDVKQYHITDNHFDFTINVTAPNGSTIRITGGDETYTGTGTGSSQAFAVHAPSTTYTIAVTMDGNTKSDTVTSAATTGQSDSVTIEFGTINVSVAADFVTAGSTITCVNGGTSCTPKTAASTLVFRVPTTGTWTISGEINGTPYSVNATVTSLGTPVSVALQTTVTVTVTMYGAVGAVIAYTDANGAQTQTLDSNGQATNVSITAMANSNIVFEDTTVAKDPDNLSNNYTKSVTITEGMTDIYVMPASGENMAYWYGYKGNVDSMNNVSSSWGYNYSVNLNQNTNYVQTSGASGIATPNSVSGTIIKAIMQHTGGGLNESLTVFRSKTSATGAIYENDTVSTIHLMTNDTSGQTLTERYIAAHTTQGSAGSSSAKVYALWAE
jgi:hypothetical protein